MTVPDLSGAVWRKSTRSSGNGQCVEVATLPRERVGIRDSKDRNGPALTFDSTGWRFFVAGIKNGDFDDLSS